MVASAWGRMRSVGRRLFSIGSAVSVTLCALIATLWVRSYFAADSLSYGWVEPNEAGGGYIGVFSSRGVLHFNDSRSRYWIPDTQGLAWNVVSPNPHIGGAASPIGWMRSSRSNRSLSIADWVLMVPTAIVPGVHLMKRRKDRRRGSANLCSICGYDLRATPKRCPECGTSPAEAKS